MAKKYLGGEALKQYQQKPFSELIGDRKYQLGNINDFQDFLIGSGFEEEELLRLRKNVEEYQKSLQTQQELLGKVDDNMKQFSEQFENTPNGDVSLLTFASLNNPLEQKDYLDLLTRQKWFHQKSGTDWVQKHWETGIELDPEDVKEIVENDPNNPSSPYKVSRYVSKQTGQQVYQTRSGKFSVNPFDVNKDTHYFGKPMIEPVKEFFFKLTELGATWLAEKWNLNDEEEQEYNEVKSKIRNYEKPIYDHYINQRKKILADILGGTTNQYFDDSREHKEGKVKYAISVYDLTEQIELLERKRDGEITAWSEFGNNWTNLFFGLKDAILNLGAAGAEMDYSRDVEALDENQKALLLAQASRQELDNLNLLKDEYFGRLGYSVSNSLGFMANFIGATYGVSKGLNALSQTAKIMKMSSGVTSSAGRLGLKIGRGALETAGITGLSTLTWSETGKHYLGQNQIVLDDEKQPKILVDEVHRKGYVKMAESRLNVLDLEIQGIQNEVDNGSKNATEAGKEIAEKQAERDYIMGVLSSLVDENGKMIEKDKSFGQALLFGGIEGAKEAITERFIGEGISRIGRLAGSGTKWTTNPYLLKGTTKFSRGYKSAAEWINKSALGGIARHTGSAGIIHSFPVELAEEYVIQLLPSGVTEDFFETWGQNISELTNVDFHLDVIGSVGVVTAGLGGFGSVRHGTKWYQPDKQKREDYRKKWNENVAKRREIFDMYAKLSEVTTNKELQEIIALASNGTMASEDSYQEAIAWLRNSQILKNGNQIADFLEQKKIAKQVLTAINTGTMFEFKNAFKKALRNPNVNQETKQNLQSMLSHVEEMDTTYDTYKDYVNIGEIMNLKHNMLTLNITINELLKNFNKTREDLINNTDFSQTQIPEIDKTFSELSLKEIIEDYLDGDRVVLDFLEKLRNNNKISEDVYENLTKNIALISQFDEIFNGNEGLINTYHYATNFKNQKAIRQEMIENDINALIETITPTNVKQVRNDIKRLKKLTPEIETKIEQRLKDYEEGYKLDENERTIQNGINKVLDRIDKAKSEKEALNKKIEEAEVEKEFKERQKKLKETELAQKAKEETEKAIREKEANQKEVKEKQHLKREARRKRVTEKIEQRRINLENTRKNLTKVQEYIRRERKKAKNEAELERIDKENKELIELIEEEEKQFLEQEIELNRLIEEEEKELKEKEKELKREEYKKEHERDLYKKADEATVLAIEEVERRKEEKKRKKQKEHKRREEKRERIIQQKKGIERREENLRKIQEILNQKRKEARDAEKEELDRLIAEEEELRRLEEEELDRLIAEEEEENKKIIVEAELERINKIFNEKLEKLTEENADSTIFYLGFPSEILLSAGIHPKELKLYGNKIVKKAKKHGFNFTDLMDLPIFLSDPIAIFKGNTENTFVVLTELQIGENNVIVALEIGKGKDVDFNLITSAYGKSSSGIVGWINTGKTLYINQEKTLNYLGTSTPIVGAVNNQEFNSDAKIQNLFDINEEVLTTEDTEVKEEVSDTKKSSNERYLSQQEVEENTDLTPEQKELYPKYKAQQEAFEKLEGVTKRTDNTYLYERNGHTYHVTFEIYTIIDGSGRTLLSANFVIIEPDNRKNFSRTVINSERFSGYNQVLSPEEVISSLNRNIDKESGEISKKNVVKKPTRRKNKEKDENDLDVNNTLFSPNVRKKYAESEKGKREIENVARGLVEQIQTLKENGIESDMFTFKRVMRSFASRYGHIFATNHFDIMQAAWQQAEIELISDKTLSRRTTDMEFDDVLNEMMFPLQEIFSKAGITNFGEVENVEMTTEEVNQINEAAEVVHDTYEVMGLRTAQSYSKIPFAGIDYQYRYDEEKGEIIIEDTEGENIISEGSEIFLDWDELVPGTKVKIKVSNYWKNPNNDVYVYEEGRDSKDRSIVIQKSIKIKDWLKRIFPNKTFEEVVNTDINELLKNEQFRRSVPIDLVTEDGKTFEGHGWHDYYWWNKLKVADFNSQMIATARRNVGFPLNRTNAEFAQAYPQMYQEALEKAAVFQEKVIAEGRAKNKEIRDMLFETPDFIMDMMVSNREFGTSLSNGKNKTDGSNLRTISSANPTAVLTVMKGDRHLYTVGNKQIDLKGGILGNMEAIENQQHSVGSVVMVCQVGTTVVDGKVVPLYHGYMCHTNQKQAEKKKLFDTANIIKAIYCIENGQKLPDNLREYSYLETQEYDNVRKQIISEIKKHTGINITKADVAKLTKLYPEVSKRRQLGRLINEKNQDGSDMLRYDVKVEGVSEKTIIPVIKLDGMNVIVDTQNYMETLKDQIMTHKRFVPITRSNGETIYISDIQPRIEIKPVNTKRIEEVEEEVETAISEEKFEEVIKITKEITQAEEKKEEKKDLSKNKEFNNIHKEIIVDNIFHNVLRVIDLGKGLVVSDMYTAMVIQYENAMRQLKENYSAEYKYMAENKNNFLGLTGQYFGTIRERIDNFFSIEKKQTDKIADNLFKHLQTPQVNPDSISKDTEELEENQEFEDMNEVVKSFGKQSYENDLTLSMSSKARIFFAGIPKRTPSVFGNLKQYYGVNEVLSGVLEAFDHTYTNTIIDLKAIMASRLLKTTPNVSYNEKTGKTERVRHSEYVFFEDVLQRIEELEQIENGIAPNLHILKELQYLLFQNSVRMNFLLFGKNKGNYTVQELNADNRNKEVLRLKEFKDNFKTSSLIINKGKTYQIVEKEALKLEELYEKFNRNRHHPELLDIDEIDFFFKQFGIDLNTTTIESLLNPTRFGNTNYTFASMFNSYSLIDTLMKNLRKVEYKDGLSESLRFINKENILILDNEVHIKELINFDNKFTLRTALSNYIAGKTVNKYEQPKFITYQLKKLLKDDKTLFQYLESPFSRHSLILNLLQNGYKNFDISLVSLEALKVQGTKNRIDLGVDTLSLKDDLLTMLGFFAHRSYKTQHTLKEIPLRVTKMPFPTLSDSGQVPLLQTVGLDITEDEVSEDNMSVELDERVVEAVFEQCVLPDLERIFFHVKTFEMFQREFPHLTGVSNMDVGSQLFGLMPSLNGIMVGKETLIRKLHEYSKGNNIDVREFVSKYKKQIFSGIREVINKDVNDYITINEEGKVKGIFVEQNIFGNFNPSTIQNPVSKHVFVSAEDRELQNIDSSYIQSKKRIKNSKNLSKAQMARTVVYDYVVNRYINDANIFMLFSGDVANYYTKSAGRAFVNDDVTQLQLNEGVSKHLAEEFYPKNIEDANRLISLYFNGNETEKEEVETILSERYPIIVAPSEEQLDKISSKVYIELSKDMSVNLSKRLKALISPGNILAESTTKKTYQIVVDDKVSSSEVIETLIKTHYPKKYTKGVAEKVATFTALNSQSKSLLTETQLSELKELTHFLESVFPNIAPYLETTSTDGQEYNTWQDQLDQLASQGKITSQMYDQLYKKLQNQSDNGVNENNRLTKAERKIIMQPQKPRYVGLRYKKLLEAGVLGEDSLGYSAQIMSFIKSSSFTLLPELTQGFALDNLRKNAEVIQKRHPDSNVRIAYKSAVKVGTPALCVNSDMLFLDNLSEEQLQAIEASSVELEKEYFSVQQDKPYKTGKNIAKNKRDEINLGTQFEKIILSNGINKMTEKIFPNFFDEDIINDLGIKVEDDKVSGEDLYEIYTELYRREQEILKNNLFDELGIEDYQNFDNTNIPLYEALVSMLQSRLSDQQDMEGIELVYYVRQRDNSYKSYSKKELSKKKLKADKVDFKFPVWMLPNSRKFESTLNSIITNNSIRLKLPGFGGIVASQNGFTKTELEDYVEGNEDIRQSLLDMGVVLTPSFDGILKAEYNDNGTLKYAQVLAPNKFRVVRDGKVELINLKEYTDETGLIDFEKLPQELLQVFSFRIPTSSHQSGALVEIVGFVPESSGDLMIVPKDHTVQMGEDYDIDIRYTYLLNYIEKDGRLQRLTKEDIPENNFEALWAARENLLDYRQELLKKFADRSDLWKQHGDNILTIALLEYEIEKFGNQLENSTIEELRTTIYNLRQEILSQSELSENLQNIESKSSNEIYEKLGKNTVNRHVVIEKDALKKARENPLQDNKIYSTRGRGSFHFGNPFSHRTDLGLQNTETVKDAVIAYIEWLTTEKYSHIKPEQRQWILDKLQSGELVGKTIVYYKELDEASHANALDYLINNYFSVKESVLNQNSNKIEDIGVGRFQYNFDDIVNQVSEKFRNVSEEDFNYLVSWLERTNLQDEVFFDKKRALQYMNKSESSFISSKSAGLLETPEESVLRYFQKKEVRNPYAKLFVELYNNVEYDINKFKTVEDFAAQVVFDVENSTNYEQYRITTVRNYEQQVAQIQQQNPEFARQLTENREENEARLLEYMNNNRKSVFDEWINQTKRLDPFLKAIIMKSISQYMTKNNERMPSPYDEHIANRVISGIESKIQESIIRNKPITKINFHNVYSEELRRKYAEKGDYEVVYDKDGNLIGKWIRIKGEQNDPEGFESNVKQLKMLSLSQWCTSSYNAAPYLKQGDFFVYIEQGQSKASLGIKLGGNKSYEEGVYDDKNVRNEINEKNLPVLQQFINSRKDGEDNSWSSAKEVVQKILDTEIYEEERRKKRRKLLENEANILTDPEILQLFTDITGVVINIPEEAFFEDETASISNYFFIIDEVSIGHRGIFEDDNDLCRIFQTILTNTLTVNEDFYCPRNLTSLGKLKRIDGVGIFDSTTLESLGNLEYVGNGLYLRHTLIKSIGNLKEVRGTLFLEDCKIDNLNGIEYLGGLKISNMKNVILDNIKEINGDFFVDEDCKVSFKNLETVTGFITFVSKYITSLENIKTVGGDLSIKDTQIETLGNLETVGGNVNLYENKELKSLGNLETVGGHVNLNSNEKLKSLGKLKEIGGDFYVNYNKTLESLGKLRRIGGSLIASNSILKDLGDLENVGSNVNLEGVKTLKSLGKLKKIGSFLVIKDSSIEDLGDLERIDSGISFENTQIKSLGKVKIINGNVIFSHSQIEDLGNLEYIGGDVSFKNTQIKSLGNLKYINGNAVFEDSQIKSLGNLYYIGEDANFVNSKITSLNKLYIVKGSVYTNSSEIESLGDLTFVGKNFVINDNKVTTLDNLLYIGGYFKYDENLKSFGKLKYVEGNIYSGNNSSLSKEKAELKQGSSFLLKKKFDEEVDIINTKNKEEIDRFNEFPFSFQYGITNKMREDAQKWDYIISDNWVSELTGEEFQKDDIPLTEKVTQFYKDNYNGQVEKDGLGTVLLDKRGVKSSLAHGIGSIKAAAFAAVPSIIQHGVIIDEQINWKGRGKDTCVIAAPLKIGNEGYTGLVVVTKYQGDNRFYLHEVLLQKNLQDATFQDLLQRKSSTLEGNQEVGTQESVVADFLPNDFAKILKNLQTASEIVKLRDTDVRFQYGSSGIGDINAEMEEIKSQAIANGTFMLAPNGNKTNLTEKQWLLVRTERFKKWFGDWLKVYRIEKLRSSQDIEISGNEITPDENIKQYKTNALEYGKTLRGEYTNKDTKEKILVPKIGIKEILRHDFGDIANIQGVAAIPQIIENSIYIDTIENEDLNKHPHITHYDYYVVGLKIGGEDYTVKAVIANDRNGQRYYDHALTQIEKGKLLDEVEGVTSPARQEEVFQKYKDKRLISILQVNSSKVVDENGEPMVVYHGTNKRFTVFDKNRIGSSTMDNAPFYGDGFYFSWDGGFAAPYALDENEKWSENSNINEAFLNIRNPLFVEDNNTEYRGKEIPSDYDGVILNSWMEFVAKEPNQIKSAIENTGEFNSENPDIRYFETPDGEVYGFVTPDNKVFLDIENMNFNTPIHEFGHLWNSFVYENHRELWNKGAELIKKTIYWELVNKDPRYKNLSEKQRLDEALATAIGDRGEQLLQNNKANNSLKAWLNELWNWIKKYMGIRDLNSDEISKLTFEEFIHGALADLLSGQSINKEMTIQNQLQDKINKIKNVLRQNETNPYHDYQIQKKAEGLKKAVLENNLISMYKSVFGTGNINVNKLITEVLNTEFAGNTADLIQKKLSEQNSENDLFTVLSPQHQKDMMKQGASGQLGISVHSAILAFMGLVQQSPEPIQFKRGKKNIKMVFGNLETNGLISKTMAVTPVRGNTNVTPRSMATINMENQNVSVDNQKLLIMAKRNENRHTINAFTVLSNVLGIDNDGLEVEGQEVSYPSLFLSQPILRRYVELMDYFNSATTEMGFETEKSVESVLIKEFGKDVTWDSSEDGTLTEGKLDHKVFQSTSLKLTSQHLYNSLINSDGNTQWTVYEKFKQLNNLSGIISKLQKFMNIENGGIGKSFFDVIEKKNFLIEELPFMNAELSNATGLIGEYAFTSDNEDISNLEDEGFIYIGENFENSSVLIKPTTPQGHKIVNSIVQADSLWGNIFPFESRYIKSQIDQVVQNSGVKTGTQKELNLKYKVLSDLKDYLYSTCTKSFGMTQQDDIDLFVDTETNKSLASYLCHLRLQKHPLMSMDFFNMLEFSLEGNTEPSLVKLNVTGLKKEEKSRIYNTLRQLYSSNEMLPDYNRQSYSYKELIRDLARYSLIANQENGAIGFRQYIPIEVFEDYGVLSVIKATAHTNSYTQHNLLYNSGGKALESLLGTSVNSDGIIVNGNHISAEIIKSYIEKINSKAGREEFKLKGKDVEVLNKKNDKFVSNFVKQYFQHNPEDALRIQFKKDNLQVMADEQKRIKGFVAPEGSNIAMNDFVHYKDKEGKIHLYQNVGKRTFLLIGKLGIFGVNEYNALATRRTSIFDVNKEGVVLYGNSSVPVQIQDIAGENEVKRYTLQSAFEKILKGDSKYKEVASFFMKYADSDVVVEFSNKLDESKDGAYTSKNKTIYLRSDLVNNEDFKVNQTVLLHEFMHSLTMDLIEQYVDLDIDENGKLTVLFKTDDIPQGLSKLISVYRFAIDKIVEEHGVEKFVRLFNQFKQDRTDISNEIEYAEEDMDIYFASDINEFIAGIFFDNQFKKKMSKVEYKSSNKSLLQNFVEALLKMYNSIFSTEGSIAQHTVDALVDLLETTQSVSKIPSPLSVQTVPSDMIDTDRMAESLIDKDFRIVDPNEVYQAMEKKGFPTGEFTAIIDDKEVKNTGNKIFVPTIVR